ncbi:DUF2512 family protein [Lysinibacillus telephonicus]|uniref:DUF2512 family protein n=1 Tax=Lysinibacillus telephonicus TaxID=1714840 RepID=A0A3S0JQM4_9BACI|nr:DUF2512 family protein [Lysinibacillus telephonicus]RTQ93910.1 DUF2512 family protein [Lysinibacillus telephonicus]
MKRTKAFFIKLAMTFGVLLLVLGLFFGVSLADILIITFVLTIVAFVGDLFILPRIGGASAAGADLVLAFLVIWALGAFLFDPDISVFSAALLSSLFIAGGEFYYHKYLVDHLFENETEHVVRTPKDNLITQAEFSEDFDKGTDNYKEKQQDDANMS